MQLIIFSFSIYPVRTRHALSLQFSNFFFRIFFFQAIPLIVEMLSFCQRYLHFRQTAVVYKHLDWNDCESLFGAFRLEFAQFLHREKKFAVAFRNVIVICPESVFRYVHAHNEQLVLDEGAVGVGEAGLSFAYALDFRACQDDAGGVAVDEEILERRPLVLDAYSNLFDLVRHYLMSPKINGMPSLLLPTMTIFELGDSASFNVASMPFSRKILSLILALTMLFALAFPSASTR